MTPDEDNWVQSAFHHPDLVANLLSQLRQSSHPLSPPKTWSIRQPRSKPPPPPTAAATKSPPARASPTTPLSWSGTATSVSGGVEDSGFSRSIKVIGSNETTPTKRPRKKKTLAELRDEEMVLLKERKQLKRQLASLQATCQKKRKDNERLNKMKDDMKSQMLAGSEVNDSKEGKKNDGFVLPDLNIPVGDDC